MDAISILKSDSPLTVSRANRRLLDLMQIFCTDTVQNKSWPSKNVCRKLPHDVIPGICPPRQIMSVVPGLTPLFGSSSQPCNFRVHPFLFTTCYNEVLVTWKFPWSLFICFKKIHAMHEKSVVCVYSVILIVFRHITSTKLELTKVRESWIVGCFQK